MADALSCWDHRLTTGDLDVCPHCEQGDGVERYVGTGARYCSHCETKWIGRREPKAKAAA